MDHANLSAEDFSPHLKGVFKIHFSEAEQANGLPALVELTLVEVETLPAPASLPSAARRGFTLLFSGPLLGPQQRGYLPQHTYPVEHPTLGAIDIFLVPLGPQAGHMRYQAIFN